MESKWVRKLILIIVCAIFGMSFFIILRQNSNQNTINATTREVLQRMESRDISTIREDIIAIQKENEGLPNTDTLAGRLKNTIIIGDSIAEGLIDYNVLPSDIIISVRGASVDRVKTQIQEVITRQPKVVFLEFGMNDLERFWGEPSLFIESYKLRIKELRAGLNNVAIYINSILPIQQIAIDQVPDNAKYDSYNQALKDMCKEMNITYIDNNGVIASIEDGYERDGIHPKYAYYPKWAKHMADIAGL